MSPTRAQTRTARSGDEPTNHEATAPQPEYNRAVNSYPERDAILFPIFWLDTIKCEQDARQVATINISIKVIP